jgi:hypothetical protein
MIISTYVFWHSGGCSDFYKREGNILFSKCSSYFQLNHDTLENVVEMPSIALIEREATTGVSLFNTLLLYHHMILNADVFLYIGSCLAC